VGRQVAADLTPFPSAHAAYEIAGGQFASARQGGDASLRDTQPSCQRWTVEEAVLLQPELLGEAGGDSTGQDVYINGF
jgi:hypothetical protein